MRRLLIAATLLAASCAAVAKDKPLESCEKVFKKEATYLTTHGYTLVEGVPLAGGAGILFVFTKDKDVLTLGFLPEHLAPSNMREMLMSGKNVIKSGTCDLNGVTALYGLELVTMKRAEEPLKNKIEKGKI